MPPSDPRFGPSNPHPLSRVRTEFIWEGKYDEYGARRQVDVAALAMPMQRIETIDEPRTRTEAQGGLFDAVSSHPDDFRNALIWGDNKLVAASLLRDFKGRVDLVYIDPPFDLGSDFTMDVPLGDEDEVVEKDQSTLEMVAYRDTWGRGTDSYLHMLYERLVLIRDLMSERGTIYVHVGATVGAAVKLMLDEVFGRSNFRNNIRWRRMSISGFKGKQKLPFNHETLYCYTRSDTFTFNPIHQAYSEEYKARFRYADADGRHYRADQNLGTATSPERIAAMELAGLIHVGDSGKRYRKQYLDELPGVPLDDIWTDVPWVTAGDQRLAFPTQKPDALLRRVIAMSSNEGDLVADLFCGSGTTGAVAEDLGRRWLMADLGRFAIHTTRKRLIELQRIRHASGQPYRPFDVHNLGRYERQWWQKELLVGADADHRRVVLAFFRAEPLQHASSPLLHGRKGAAYCHVDNIDSIFTRGEAADVALAAASSGAKEIVCLAWEFEMDLRIECNRLESELGVKIKLIMIPREIMEKNRKDPPPFLEVATLTAVPVIDEGAAGPTVDIKLTSFVPSLAEIPTKELEALSERAVARGFDFIDFWAVDFDYHENEPFHHDWQDYRLRRDRSLKLQSAQRHVYREPGDYVACVKVVDIFGADTSITVGVTVA
jgi:DNA modification methylase